MPDQRLLFSKTGRARYISHLDLMRTFQRSFLRAGISVRHTEGFNPHAYVSMPLPLSVGFSSECEILECGLPEGIDREELPWRLTRVLPEGITVHKCYDAERPVKELAYVRYIITLEYDAGAPVGAENAIRALLSRESLIVTKKSKKSKTGEVQVDLVPLIKKIDYEGRRDAIVLDAVLKAQNPGLNPTLLLTAIEGECPEAAPDYVSYHRKRVLDESMKIYR
ncbi:MAG: DUF2344 domain-containing protein [Clostridia bacterium]|nr:DUF2344 domain-containing protein [Clostridia bacterium]